MNNNEIATDGNDELLSIDEAINIINIAEAQGDQNAAMLVTLVTTLEQGKVEEM